MAKLVPVDGDPFAQKKKGPTSYSFKPVDGDPFLMGASPDLLPRSDPKVPPQGQEPQTSGVMADIGRTASNTWDTLKKFPGRVADNFSQSMQAGSDAASQLKQDEEDALKAKTMGERFTATNKQVMDIGKGLLSDFNALLSPVTAAGQTAGDVAADVTANRDFGDRVDTMTQLAIPLGPKSKALEVGEGAVRDARIAEAARLKEKPVPLGGEAVQARSGVRVEPVEGNPFQSYGAGVDALPTETRAAAREGEPPALRSEPVAPAEAAAGKKINSDIADTLGVDGRPRGSVGAAAAGGGPSTRAGDARALIRQKIGEGERASRSTAAELEPFSRRVNALTDPERLRLYDYIENRTTTADTLPEDLQPVADTLRKAFKERESALRSSYPTADMNFIEDYFPHMWQDPNAADEFVKTWYSPKQGSGAALKKRELPTIADGLAAGLKLKYADPIEAATMYTANMDRYIAMNEIMDTATTEGTVVYRNASKAPKGYVPLSGRLGQKNTPAGVMYAFAPKDWARDYNNFVSRGWHEVDPKLGTFMDNARAASNAVTFAELSLSAFHLSTMAGEAVASDWAKAVGELFGLRPDKALATLAKMPAAPVRHALMGKQAQRVYLGLTPGTARQRELIDLLTQSNMRMTGMDKTLRQTAAGSFWTAWRRGALKMQLKESAGQIKGPVSALKVAVHQMARAAETLQQPIFEKYIPVLKNGAAMDLLGSWLDRNPMATNVEKLDAARKITDSIDNRFGEMVQDNLFFNQVVKQTAQVMMRSYSWNLGTLRELGGGAKDILMTGGKALSPASSKYSPRAAYVVGLPLAYCFNNAVYQYLKTGESPQSIDDLLAPRTGGVDAGTGKPERAALPSYMKDVFGWYENGPTGEAYNKLATGPKAVYELAANKDWKGDPIRGPDPSGWWNDYMTYVLQSFGPITVRQIGKGEKRGSGLTGEEQFLGIRPAPRYFTDPEGYSKMMGGIADRKWKDKLRKDKKQQNLYEEPAP